jgi:glycine dehydrogenase subunit 2
MKTFHGHIGVIAKAWAYVTILGAEGLKSASETAVLNANYVLDGLKDVIDIPRGTRCFHEFVASCERLKADGIHAMDVAKRLIDYGYHPPTVYFPLIVKEAVMIEPTETEGKETLDTFISDFRKIIGEAKTDPSLLLEAPHGTPVGRVDEARAAREIIRES